MCHRKNNLALCYQGILVHRMTGGKELDDFTLDELKALVALYRKQFFKIDYPGCK